MVSTPESQTTEISKAVIFYKLVLGLIELSLGVGTLLFGHTIFRIYTHFRAQELLEDPHDTLIFVIEALSPTLVRHRTYIVFFLLILGTTKIVGSIGLLYKKEWGLDLIIGLFVFLFPFDLYSLATQPNLSKLIYFLINILITLYLMQFKPHLYMKRLHKYFQRK